MYPGLKNYIYKVIKDTDECKDIAEKTMITIYNKIDTYDEEYQLTTWSYKIALNYSLQYLKDLKKKVSYSYNTFDEDNQDSTNSLLLNNEIVKDYFTNNSNVNYSIEKEKEDKEKEIKRVYDIVIKDINENENEYERLVLTSKYIDNLPYLDILKIINQKFDSEILSMEKNCNKYMEDNDMDNYILEMEKKKELNRKRITETDIKNLIFKYRNILSKRVKFNYEYIY